MIKIGDLDIAATWDDVLFVGQYSRDELELFTRDILVEVIVNNAPNDFVYQMTLDGEVYNYTRQIGETNEDVAANWIADLSASRELFYKFIFETGEDFDDIIAVQPKQELLFFPVTVGSNLTLRESSEPDTPLKYGGRSNILLETARRCKLSVYNDRLGDAQKYLAAHFALQSLAPPPGQGTTSNESFDGESISYTMPTNNPKAGEEELMTIAGKRFLRIRSSRIVRYRVY